MEVVRVLRLAQLGVVLKVHARRGLGETLVLELRDPPTPTAEIHDSYAVLRKLLLLVGRKTLILRRGRRVHVRTSLRCS